MRKLQLAAVIAGGLAMVLIAAALFPSPRHETAPDLLAAVHVQSALGRTLHILQSSNPGDRKTLRVLFYGQSIVASGWHERVAEHWKTKYPHTNFIVENLAIGGFAAQHLVRTAARDVRAFYPDLIVFHVYGDHRAYEEIIQIFRRETSADIIVQTDHANVMPENKCRAGFQFKIPAPAGCKGFFWYKQKNWEDEMSFHRIPAIAEKYGLIVQPQRTAWRGYLMDNDLAPGALLADKIHLNERGKEFMAALLIDFFDAIVASTEGAPGVSVEIIDADAAQMTAPGGYRFSFSGTRLEADLLKPLPDGAVIRIDGRDTREIDACYSVSRASAPPNAPEWPAIRQISFGAAPIEENWIARFSDFNHDNSEFTFVVEGGVTGEDGQGTGNAAFTSDSGRVVFDPSDWMFQHVRKNTDGQIPDGFEMRWSVEYLCDDHFAAARSSEGDWRVRQTLITGLPAIGPHNIEIVPPNGAEAGIDRFIAYRPPLAD